jgi:hypothetical protein
MFNSLYSENSFPVNLAQWLHRQLHREAEIGKIMVWGQPGQKVCESPISTNKLGIVVHACHPATWEE